MTQKLAEDDSSVVYSIEPSHRVKAAALGKDKGSTNSTELHSLPCTIHHDGQRAAVSVYFRPVPLDGTNDNDESGDASTVTNGSEYVAQLRGRRLLGQKMKLPPNVAGWVVASNKAERNHSSRDKSSDRADDASKTLLINSTFQTMTEWGHDGNPSKRQCGGLTLNATKMQRALDWFDLSQSVSYKSHLLQDDSSCFVR
jgi:hypothetical protein